MIKYILSLLLIILPFGATLAVIGATEERYVFKTDKVTVKNNTICNVVAVPILPDTGRDPKLGRTIYPGNSSDVNVVEHLRRTGGTVSTERFGEIESIKFQWEMTVYRTDGASCKKESNKTVVCSMNPGRGIRENFKCDPESLTPP